MKKCSIKNDTKLEIDVANQTVTVEDGYAVMTFTFDAIKELQKRIDREININSTAEAAYKKVLERLQRNI